jgi:hypothetical protein
MMLRGVDSTARHYPMAEGAWAKEQAGGMGRQ